MKKLSKLLLIGLLVSLLIGCSNEAPNCTDSDTKDLVIKIAEGEIVKRLGEEVADSVTLSLENIITKGINEKVGSFECAADLRVTGPGGTKSGPITYTSELGNDGDDFYVNVYGL